MTSSGHLASTRSSSWSRVTCPGATTLMCSPLTIPSAWDTHTLGALVGWQPTRPRWELICTRLSASSLSSSLRCDRIRSTRPVSRMRVSTCLPPPTQSTSTTRLHHRQPGSTYRASRSATGHLTHRPNSRASALFFSTLGSPTRARPKCTTRMTSASTRCSRQATCSALSARLTRCSTETTLAPTAPSMQTHQAWAPTTSILRRSPARLA
mmetsp:Transcript_7/g.15  ORF Transcript_7/g.15 Transcript_7/m.15 type:complete len:210 (-) Transcript_7:611-1240(-)